MVMHALALATAVPRSAAGGAAPVAGNGDITGFEILGPAAFAAAGAPMQNVNANGGGFKMTIKGASIGQTLNASKILVQVTSPTFSSLGAATTASRNVTGAKALRRPIPPNWVTGEAVAVGTRRMTVTSGFSRPYISATAGTTGATAPKHQPWAQGTTYIAAAVVVVGANYYSTTAGGTAGSTMPLHTSGTVSDGGVLWTYQGASTSGGLSDGGVVWVYGGGAAGVTPVYEEQVGPDAVVYGVLSDYIHEGTTDIVTSVTVQAGAYGSSLASNPAFFTPVNSSTLAQEIADVIEVMPPWQGVENVLRAEIAVSHPFGQQGRTAACVQFKVVTSAGIPVIIPATVVGMSRSTYLTAGANKTQVFGQNIDTSALTPGTDYYLEYEVYPWRGAAFKSSVNGYGVAFPVAASAIPVNNQLRIPFRRVNGNRVYALVDPVLGNNATGQAIVATSGTINGLLPSMLPFLTIDGAYSTATRGIVAVNNTSLGQNNTADTVCYLNGGTYSDGFGGTNMNGRPRGTVWSTIDRNPVTTTSAADVIFQASATLNNKRSLTRVKYGEITLQGNTGTAVLDNQAPNTVGEYNFEQWFDKTVVTGGATGSQRVLFRMGLSWYTNCDVTSWGSQTNLDNRSNIKLSGNNAFKVSGGVPCTCGAVNGLGNTFTDGANISTCGNTLSSEGNGSTVVPLQSAFWAFNAWPHCVGTPKFFNYLTAGGDIQSGTWMMNYVEVFDISPGVGSAKSGELSGDLPSAVSRPLPRLIHMWNTYPGEGINLIYNESGVTAAANVYKRMYNCYNVFGDLNMKADYYDSSPEDWSQYRVGNLLSRNAVGCHKNFLYAPDDDVASAFNLSGEVFPADWVIGAKRSLGGTDPKFVNDQSHLAPTGSRAGNGDYHGTTTSPHKGMIGATEQFFPEDLYGGTRRTDGTAVPGAFEWV